LPKVAVMTNFDDIKFQCQRCGSCCHHRRPAEFDDLVPIERLAEFVERSNLIYLTPKDIHDIGHRAMVKADDFVDTLYEYDGNCIKTEDDGRKVILDLPVMRSKEDTTCVFYREGCTVYKVRPKACRLFPFRVEEKSTPEGDILLKISYNPSCPGIGKGECVNKGKLEKLVADQFLRRSEEISSRIQRLVAHGRIAKSPQIFRTHPGRRRDNHVH